MKKEFYSITKEIDNIKSANVPSQYDIIKLIGIIGESESLQRYFFRDFNKEAWFEILEQNKVFDVIKKPETTTDGQVIFHPPWWPGEYLLKVADKIPDKVLNVIKKVQTENRPALDICGEAILKMDPDFLIKEHTTVIEVLNKWLEMKNIGFIHKRAIDLFGIYIKKEFYDGAYKLLDILSKTRVDGKGKAKFRFEAYYYQRMAETHLPKLIGQDPFKVLEIIEPHFRAIIKRDTAKEDRIDDYSTYWRPEIEDSEGAWKDDIQNILIDVLRDALQGAIKSNQSKGRDVILTYLKDEYPVFKRLAIHTIRTENLDDLVESVIGDETYLDNTRTYHEFFKLVQEKFGVLQVEQKKQFINRIITKNFTELLNSNKSDELYVKFWQARRILMIRKYIEEDEALKEFKHLLDSFKDIFDKIERPDVLAWSESWSGPTSELSKEQIASMLPADFIDWIKSNSKQFYRTKDPSPLGTARIFKDIVANNPQPYATAAEKFIDDKIWPAYLCELMRGFGEAVKGGKTFDLTPVLNLMENPLKFKEGPKVSEKQDEFDIGQYSWFRGAISDFIEELVKKDTPSLSQEQMDRTLAVLIELIEKDQDPDEESEKKYGPEANNMNYVDYCINTNRGKAMRALMYHALMAVKRTSDKENPLSKEKIPLYKNFLTKRLDIEKSPSVQSCYGLFLSHLLFIDKDWVTLLKKEGKLFPSHPDRTRFWQAHFEGFTGFNRFNSNIYVLLRDDYKRAVENINKDDETQKKYNRYSEHLVNHLMVAYWRQLEGIEEIVELFFKKAPEELRGGFIKSLSRAMEEVKPKDDSNEWKRLKALWEKRIRVIKDNELGSFVYWLKHCPENLDNIVKLVETIIPYLYRGYQEEDLLEYLKEKINSNPLNTLILLNKLLENEESIRNIYYRKDFLTEILKQSGTRKGDTTIAKEINKAVNRLGEVGYYEFKEYLVE